MTPPDASSQSPPLPVGLRPQPRTRPGALDPLVGERLRARRRRVADIRKRIATIAATVFAALWGVIFVQLVTGHDPALSRHRTASATAAGSSASASSGSTSPVTTSQS